jgi:hypothetical protein
MAEHKHEWGFDGIDMFDCIHDDCNERMDMDEAEKRCNVMEDMLTWEDGIYTGTQIRDFARLISDPASIGS